MDYRRQDKKVCKRLAIKNNSSSYTVFLTLKREEKRRLNDALWSFLDT